MNDDDKPSLSEAIRLLTERDRRSLGAHPGIEELAAYHSGELEPQAEARVREHIAVCRECSGLLLDLINFADLAMPPGEPDLSDDEMEEDWQALRARMGEAEEPARPAAVVPIRPAAPAPPPSRAQSPWFSLAASLLAVLGIGFAFYQSAQVARLSDQIKAHGQPSVEDTFILQDNGVRGGSEDATEPAKKMSARKGGTILLSPTEDGPGKVEIVQGGEVLWGTAIEGDQAEIPIDIPGGFLKPGSYTVRVSGPEGGGRESDREYTLEVVDP